MQDKMISYVQRPSPRVNTFILNPEMCAQVDDEIQGEIEEPINEPHYQTLEEVREEVSASVEPAPVPPSPPQQVASKPPAVIEPPEVGFEQGPHFTCS